MGKRICSKEGCNNVIPRTYITPEGKKIYLQRRKYCLECSPFGEHNTKNLNKKKYGYGSGVCPKCGRPSQKGHNKCYSCYYNERKDIVAKSIYNLIGTKCWYCNYDKGFDAHGVLDLHHINPEEKKFCISTREMVGVAWKRLKQELSKCVLLCSNCHREYHLGLICDDTIKTIHSQKWEEIDLDSLDSILDIKKRFENKNRKICPICNKEFVSENIYCSKKCWRKSIRKVNRPDQKELLQDIEKLGYCGAGRKYGVSDNAIRKWIKK